METKDKTVVHLDVDNSEYIQRPLLIYCSQIRCRKHIQGISINSYDYIFIAFQIVVNSNTVYREGLLDFFYVNYPTEMVYYMNHGNQLELDRVTCATVFAPQGIFCNVLYSIS